MRGENPFQHRPQRLPGAHRKAGHDTVVEINAGVLAQGLGMGAHLGCRGREIVPVSYTHLRAHETVLDRVCRLLLENKNATCCYSVRERPQTVPTLTPN